MEHIHQETDVHIGAEDVPLRTMSLVIAGTFVFCSICMAVYSIICHLLRLTNFSVQRYYMRIILMAPIYSVFALLGLFFYHYSLYFNLARECYEAYTMYSFLRLLREYLGPEESLIEWMEQQPKLPHVACYSWCFPAMKLGRRFLFMCRGAVLQFLVVKVTLSIVASILFSFSKYRAGHFDYHRGYFWCTCISAVSISVAMYGLVCFYLATKPLLEGKRPLIKFACIKLVVFGAFWQSVIVSGLVKIHVINDISANISAENVSEGLQSFIICIEMFFASILFHYGFHWEEFTLGGDESMSPPDLFHTLKNSFSVREVFTEVSEVGVVAARGMDPRKKPSDLQPADLREPLLIEKEDDGVMIIEKPDV